MCSTTVVKLQVVITVSGNIDQRVMRPSLATANLAGASTMPGAMVTAALHVMPGAMTKYSYEGA